MLRVFKDGGSGAYLDDLAEIHHGYPVTDPFDDGHVVADEQVGQLQALLQVEQQVADLRLDGDIERRNRLIRDDYLGIEHQRPRNRDALPLPAGEFVREAPHHVGRKPHLLEKIRRLVTCLLLRTQAVLEIGLHDR